MISAMTTGVIDINDTITGEDIMRYSISGDNVNVDYVLSIGGRNIKNLSSARIIFADLEPGQVSILQTRGCTVLPVERVQRIPGSDQNGLRILARTVEAMDGAFSSLSSASGTLAPFQPPSDTKMYRPQDLLDAANLGLLSRYQGAGVNIAVIDTGIRETHDAVRGHIIFSKNYTSDIMEDGFNHGTNVASIILAVVPQANLLNMKIMNSEGDGSTEEIVEAIDDCINMIETDPAMAPAIINISAGTTDNGNPNDPLRVACRAAVESGIWVSAAAGNLGPSSGSIVSPACERYVFATGSISMDPAYNISEFSSRGPTKEGLVKPDAVFFGENIIVAGNDSDTSYICKSGTSFSAPFSTGIAALYLEALARIPAESITSNLPLEGNIISPITAEDLLDGGLGPLCVKPAQVVQQTNLIKDNDYGYGILDGRLIAQSLEAGTLAPLHSYLASQLNSTLDVSGLVVAMSFVALMKIMTSVNFTKSHKEFASNVTARAEAKKISKLIG